MPNRVKYHEGDSFKILIWDTGNLSVQTTIPLDVSSFNELLIGMQYFPRTHIKSFINLVNLSVTPDEPKSFIYVNTKDTENMVEYICNECIIRITNDEMRVDISLNPDSSPEAIMNSLSQSNIVYGIDHKALQQHIDNKDTSFFTIATGTEPQPPKPRIYDFDFLTVRPLPIPIKKNDKVTFIDFTIQNRVLNNSELSSYSEAVPGIP